MIPFDVHWGEVNEVLSALRRYKFDRTDTHFAQDILDFDVTFLILCTL